MRVSSLLLLCLLLVGCSLDGSGGGATIERGQLESLVLQPQDLPPAFVQFDGGRQVIADTPGGKRSDRARFGRIDGWKARYRRPGSAATPGPLVVESRADLFRSAEGAEDELEAIAETDFAELEPPRLGDEAKAFESRQGASGQSLVYFLVAWREHNVTSLILASGFARRFSFDDALALARKQQARLAAAGEP